MDAATMFLLVLVSAVGLGLVAREVARGRVFSLFVVYTLIFLSELVGGVFWATLSDPQMGLRVSDPADVSRTLMVAGAGYLLFVLGYRLAGLSGRYEPARRQAELQGTAEFFARCWNTRYRAGLLIITALVIGAGFIQFAQRQSIAGGWDAFKASAYQYRFGTLAESEKQGALLGFFNIVGGSALAFVGIYLCAWFNGRLGRFTKLLAVVLLIALSVKQALSMYRSAVFFSVFAVIAIYHSNRRLSFQRLAAFGCACVVFLIGLNIVHQYMYWLTAGWSARTFSETLLGLVGAHGHFGALDSVLSAHAAGRLGLGGSGLLESVFFFVPRFLWEEKALAADYGTLLLQARLGLPTTYQIAVTNLGELIAHFGWIGMLGMIGYGFAYGILDSLAVRTLEMRCAVFGVLIPRVLADQGMGLSAFAVSLFELGLFLTIAASLRFFATTRLTASRRRPAAAYRRTVPTDSGLIDRGPQSARPPADSRRLESHEDRLA